MKIAICSSIDFTDKIKEISEKLKKEGHEVVIPLNAEKIIKGEISLEEYKRIKESRGDLSLRKSTGIDLIKRYFEVIRNCDAILVINEEKRSIKDYIGGNTLMEMGFAFILEKKIFILNRIPEMVYKDEILSMNPIVLNSELKFS